MSRPDWAKWLPSEAAAAIERYWKPLWEQLGLLPETQPHPGALELEAVVLGRGERTVWALYLQVLRELAQHAGHADILREQILAAG